MSFISILLALLLEQARPLGEGSAVHRAARAWVRWVRRNFDSSRSLHVWLGWLLMVLAPGVVAMAVYWLLVETVGWAAAVVWNILVLYATLGFRQFSHHYTAIRDALSVGDEDGARQLLAQWMRIDASELPRSEIVRHVIEHSVCNAHRHVFGVFLWYSVFTALGCGPAGAVVYRLGDYVFRKVTRASHPMSTPASAPLQELARAAWAAMDWVPARATALAFAFVGSFEDAVDNWRQCAAQGALDNDAILLASTAGAVNVKLGPREAQGAGQTPQASHLRAVVGLLWRAVVMWLVLLALLSMARLLG